MTEFIDKTDHGYRVVHAADVQSLVQRVTRAQRDGWIVTGGLVHALGAFYQAMVRGIPCSR